jgi:hypothetical protein
MEKCPTEERLPSYGKETVCDVSSMCKRLVEQQAVLPEPGCSRALFDTVPVQYTRTDGKDIIANEAGDGLIDKVLLDPHIVVAKRDEFSSSNLQSGIEGDDVSVFR